MTVPQAGSRLSHLAFRDALAERPGFELIVYTHEAGRAAGVNALDHGDAYTSAMRTDALKQALDRGDYDIVLGGAPRDVLMRDRETGHELVGRYVDQSTNFAHATVDSVGAARAFAERIDFPRHGLIIIAQSDGKPAPDQCLCKDVQTVGALSESVAEVLALCGVAPLETDMRARRSRAAESS